MSIAPTTSSAKEKTQDRKLEEITKPPQPYIAKTPARPTSMADEPADALPEELAANLDEIKSGLPKDGKKAARWAFHAVNFLGLHFIFNSTLSLFIAYNLLPTKAAKATMNWAAKVATPINAAIYKLTTPIKKFIQGSAFKELSKVEMEANIAHSARSRVETAFMCIAGFVALWPVKFLEDHRAEFINFVDNLFHPGRSKAEREAVALKPEDEPKETWTNLIRARIVGLGVVFSVDALQQRFNNWLGYEKGNIDTAVWKWGANVSDKMNPNWRKGIVNFFSRKGINLAGIQPEVRSDLLKAIDSPKEIKDLSHTLGGLQERLRKTTDKAVQERLTKEIETLRNAFKWRHPELMPQIQRAIFAEQSRLLLTKEIFLTLVVSATIYTAAKAPFMARFFEKIGLKKKEEKTAPENAASDIQQQPVSAPVNSEKDQKPVADQVVEQQENSSQAEKNAKKVITPSKVPPEQFAARHPSKNEQGWENGVAKTDPAAAPHLSQAM